MVANLFNPQNKPKKVVTTIIFIIQMKKPWFREVYRSPSFPGWCIVDPGFESRKIALEPHLFKLRGYS